jgi:photosystem II stability/assembly factor-like uncharacterized protein
MKMVLYVLAFMLVVSVSAVAQWQKQAIDTNAGFRGLAVVSKNVVWASGTGGTVVRTEDGGASWDVIKVPGAEKLDFRDIEAFDAETAYILSIGNGEDSRIYKTADGGKTWMLQFKNEDPKAFFDAVACWDERNCLAMSDPVDGKYLLIKTTDGKTWSSVDTAKMPAAGEGEASFAASGTCLIAAGDSTAYLITGGSAARVFRSYDKGSSWTVAVSPIIKGTSGSGIFSIAMRDGKNGIIVGGNYEKPSETASLAATTRDGGRTWRSAEGLRGYRSGVAYLDKKTVIAVGTTGADISRDGGKTWSKFGEENFNAIQTDGKNTIWAVGPKGLVAKADGRKQ